MENVPVVSVLGIVVLGVAFLVGISVSKRDKRRIQDHLREQGATDIVISREWSTGAYYVEYTDRQHRRRGTHCKIIYGWFGGSEIYWKDPV